MVYWKTMAQLNIFGWSFRYIQTLNRKNTYLYIAQRHECLPTFLRFALCAWPHSVFTSYITYVHTFPISPMSAKILFTCTAFALCAPCAKRIAPNIISNQCWQRQTPERTHIQRWRLLRPVRDWIAVKVEQFWISSILHNAHILAPAFQVFWSVPTLIA